MYKAQKSPAVLHVGVSAFYHVVSFVCEDTLRHPPTRQYLSSCVEILGQVCARRHTCIEGYCLKKWIWLELRCALVLCPGVCPGKCKGMRSCPENDPGAEASLPTHFPILHSQFSTRSARRSLPGRGDVATPWRRWCHFHAAHKGWPGRKCTTVK